MPEEQAGLGPAAQENPEVGSFATKNESLAEQSPESFEIEKAPEKGAQKYEKLLQSVGQSVKTTLPPDELQNDLVHIQSFKEEEEKVEHLIKLAHTKGLPHAVQVANRLKDYYALDVFHDTIANDLWEQLVQEGLITKE